MIVYLSSSISGWFCLYQSSLSLLVRPSGLAGISLSSSARLLRMASCCQVPAWAARSLSSHASEPAYCLKIFRISHHGEKRESDLSRRAMITRPSDQAR